MRRVWNRLPVSCVLNGLQLVIEGEDVEISPFIIACFLISANKGITHVPPNAHVYGVLLLKQNGHELSIVQKGQVDKRARS